jgi:D-alanine--poly(phosphoribitol) ligase subunit 2
MNTEQAKTAITNCIYETIDELNDQLGDDAQIKKSPETLLFGEQGCLDSLGLVNLVSTAEQKLEEALNVSIPLADDRALTQEQSPFQSVNALIQYALMLYQETL